MVQNTVYINKNMKKIFVVQCYGRAKEFFDFNKLAKNFIRIFLNIIFIMKLFLKNCKINIPDFSFNKRGLN